MKKFIFTMVLAMIGFGTASAQFEKGKMYLATTTNSLGLSYSKNKNLQLNLGINAGYLFEDAWMIIGEAGIDYANKDLQTFNLGAKCRYLIEQNGLFLQTGIKYVHENYKKTDDIQITPELGYCFFLNHYLTIEPSIFYDCSTQDFDHRSNAGIKIGLAWYF